MTTSAPKKKKVLKSLQGKEKVRRKWGEKI
jgi:hypothetical protein